MQPIGLIDRRSLLGAAVALLATPALAARPDADRMEFEVWRQKHKIGSHTLAFQGNGDDFTVTIAASMQVKLGPITVFRYRHQATEIWRGGRFAELHSQTVSNSKTEMVDAVRSASGVRIETGAGKVVTVSAEAQPLTHWNQRALLLPLFNPQTGAPIKKTVTRQPGQSVALADAREVAATAYVITGDAQITDWYDAQGVWSALHGRVEDGSFIDYRRVV